MATPLKIWMVRRDIDAKEIALSLGISTRSVQKYMAGETRPKHDIAYEISDYIGVHIDKLFPNLYD